MKNFYFFCEEFYGHKVKKLAICGQIGYNTKNENRKIDFSFDSALCTSIIKMVAKLKGVCMSLVGRSPTFVII